MTDPLSDALTSLAGRRGARAAVHGNARVHPVPDAGRRLSDVGWLESVTVTRAALPPGTVSRSENRACDAIVLVPYGVFTDAATLGRADLASRALTIDRGDGYVVTRDAAKTSRLLAADRAWHAVIDARGDVVLQADLDDVVVSTLPTALLVAFEDGLAREEATGHLFELPLGAAQLDSLAVLAAKLSALYPTLPHGFIVDWRVPGVSQSNFSGGHWVGLSPWDHSASDLPAFGAAVAALAPFDLTTEVLVPAVRDAEVTQLAAAAASFNNAETLGARSVRLGSYARLAAAARGEALATTTRRVFFVQAATASAEAAEATHAAAADAGGVATATAATTAPSGPTNTAASRYDFATGRWQDGDKPTY